MRRIAWLILGGCLALGQPSFLLAYPAPKVPHIAPEPEWDTWIDSTSTSVIWYRGAGHFVVFQREGRWTADEFIKSSWQCPKSYETRREAKLAVQQYIQSILVK